MQGIFNFLATLTMVLCLESSQNIKGLGDRFTKNQPGILSTVTYQGGARIQDFPQEGHGTVANATLSRQKSSTYGAPGRAFF